MLLSTSRHVAGCIWRKQSIRVNNHAFAFPATAISTTLSIHTHTAQPSNSRSVDISVIKRQRISWPIRLIHNDEDRGADTGWLVQARDLAGMTFVDMSLGFKSYPVRTTITGQYSHTTHTTVMDADIIPGFDDSFNAITGLNGSGKSNILDAICFVLGITNMTSVRANNLMDLIYKRWASWLSTRPDRRRARMLIHG